MVGDADQPSESLPSIREVFPDQFPPPSAQTSPAEDPASGAQLPEGPTPLQDEAYAKRKYVCDTCQKRFLRPSSLKAHLVVHTGDRPYACPHAGCTKRFTSKSNMKRHHQTHGAPAPDAEAAAGPSTAPSSSAGHFGVLNLGQRHAHQPPPYPDAAGQP